MPPESPTTSLTLALRPEKYAAVSSVKHETLCRCPPAETRDLYLDQESSFDPFINRTEQQLARPTLICLVDFDRRQMPGSAALHSTETRRVGHDCFRPVRSRASQ